MARIYDALQPATLEQQGFTPEQIEFITTWGFAISALDLEPREAAHFPEGNFEQIVKPKGVKPLLDTVVAPDERWNEDDLMVRDVEVLAMDNPVIDASTHALSKIVKDLAAAGDNTLKRFELLKAYEHHLGVIADAIKAHFYEEVTDNTVCLTLLSGGRFSEDRFIPPTFDTEDGESVLQRVRVDAKRLDTQNADGKQQMYFGFRNWENFALFEQMKEKFPQGIRLVIPDDCLATAGSTIAAVEVLLSRGVKIESVAFYGTIASQQGLELLMETMEKLEIPATAVVGGLVYGLNDKGYLMRVEKEEKPDGKRYKTARPAVGDMGEIQTAIAGLRASE